MRRYLLDSNALNLFIYRRLGVHERAIELKRTGAAIGTAIPIVGELIGGTLASASWETNLPIVERKIQTLRLWPFDLPAAREYARLYADMRRNGVTVQSIDLMLAATAMLLPNSTVVSSDSDFLRVPGLSVENWAA